LQPAEAESWTIGLPAKWQQDYPAHRYGIRAAMSGIRFG
jgi:hypothetical protein